MSFSFLFFWFEIMHENFIFHCYVHSFNIKIKCYANHIGLKVLDSRRGYKNSVKRGSVGLYTRKFEIVEALIMCISESFELWIRNFSPFKILDRLIIYILLIDFYDNYRV